jgi:hypothetical protein
MNEAGSGSLPFLDKQQAELVSEVTRREITNFEFGTRRKSSKHKKLQDKRR